MDVLSQTAGEIGNRHETPPFALPVLDRYVPARGRRLPRARPNRMSREPISAWLKPNCSFSASLSEAPLCRHSSRTATYFRARPGPAPAAQIMQQARGISDAPGFAYFHRQTPAAIAVIAGVLAQRFHRKPRHFYRHRHALHAKQGDGNLVDLIKPMRKMAS